MVEKKVFKLELKSVAEDGQFVGIASQMDFKDSDEDVIDSGAFTRTLKHKDGKVFLLADHDVRQSSRIGMAGLEEQGAKLKLAGHLNLAKQVARDSLADIQFYLKHKVPLGLSVGFEIVKDVVDEGVRHIKELKLWEVSLVTFPANERAVVTGIKSVVAFQDLPLADADTEWDADAAKDRVREWAGAEEEPNAKYRRAFVWYDKEKADSFESYKLPIADVVDGKLTVIPRGVFAAANAVQGARTPLDVPDADLSKIKSHLGRYYKKLDLTAPWDKAATPDELIQKVLSIDPTYPFDEAERETAVKAIGHLNALLEASVPDDSLLKHSSDDDDVTELSVEDVASVTKLFEDMRESVTVH